MEKTTNGRIVMPSSENKMRPPKKRSSVSSIVNRRKARIIRSVTGEI
jgi:hypothetical protein